MDGDGLGVGAKEVYRKEESRVFPPGSTKSSGNEAESEVRPQLAVRLGVGSGREEGEERTSVSLPASLASVACGFPGT